MPPLVVWLVLLKVIGADLKGLYEKGHTICSIYGYELMEAKFGKEVHLLCLKSFDIASSSLLSHQPVLYLDPDNQVERPIKSYTLTNITMAYGFPVEDPSSGTAEGYIGEDNHFHGVLHFGNRTLHADPYNYDGPHRTFGAFENDHMAMPPRLRRQSQLGQKRIQFPYRIEERKRNPGVAPSRVCDLLLLADKMFFEKDANGSLKHVVMRMMHAVAQADIIFRNADFNEDGVPDNIGFAVKYILVLTSEKTNDRVFGDLKTSAVDGRTYLMRFARLRRLSEVCLGVAFSGHAFNNRTLGLSFTSLGGGMGGAAGGLCDRRAYGRSFNTLAIAHATTEDKDRVPERIAALTLAHEMGHSFGAHHDDNFPSPDCRGYLMGSQSTTLDSGKTFEFSQCSKRLIATTLGSMSYCLQEHDRPFCGNGIVEDGEACDCGLPTRCINRDPCCTPRGGGALVFDEGTLHKEGCSVAPTAQCHPSQGLCCSARCQLADLTKSGIDCSLQGDKCKCINSTECRCGLGGRCLPDGTCHAAECSLLGLRECACPEKGPGGSLGESKMCGICCWVDEIKSCVGAELAARALLAKSSVFPIDWPGDNYHGPNISIVLYKNALNNKSVTLRAWSPGNVCVVQNTVGMCSPRGQCRLDYVVPRSNVFPDTMNVKFTKREEETVQLKQSSKTEASTVLVLMLLSMIAV